MEINEGRETWNSKLLRMVNSAACFMLAYMLITQLMWVAMALVGVLIRNPSVVYYYGIRFMSNQNWNKIRIALVYGSGPVAALLLGLFGLYLYDKFKSNKGIVNLFFVWMFIVGTGIFASQGVVSSLGSGQFLSPYYQWFAVIFAWLRFPDMVVYMLNIPFSAVLIYFAINYTKPVLAFSYSYGKVNKLPRRRKYFLETIIVPFMMGVLPVTYITFPFNLFVHIVMIGVIFLSLILAWIALFYAEMQRDDVLKFKSLQKPGYVFFVLTVLMMIFIQVTWNGFNIGFD